MENNSGHWTDFVAEKIIREKGDKETYTIASGITPSGVVHIGNFREIITVELVKRALESKGKKVRFIYSWDNYDVFRKVPKNMPKQEMLTENLRKPIVDIEDPFGEEESYARHHEVKVEEDIKEVGIEPEFIYQAKKYRNCDYGDQIIVALDNREKIKKIINDYRQEPLEDDWYPISGYCPKCNKDNVKFSNYHDGLITMKCQDCDYDQEIEIKKSSFIKLPWRIDWPMRWAYEKVDFEPGGKDHSTVGGSFTTAQEIVKIYDWEAPVYQMYDFIRIKGGGGKISSSSGDVITLRECLEIYEPAIVRYLFAGTRPNREFAISFDVDVLNIYEEFDKVERIYFGEEKVKEKDEAKLKRAYELSCPWKVPKVLPYQPSFRHLTNLLQINDFDKEKLLEHYGKDLNEEDKKRLLLRASCAENWVKKYAPEEFKFKLQQQCLVTLVDQEKEMLHLFADKLLEREWTPLDLHEEIYILCKNKEFPISDFFRINYQVLINKDKGPRLASFVLEIGREKVAELLKKV